MLHAKFQIVGFLFWRSRFFNVFTIYGLSESLMLHAKFQIVGLLVLEK